jgi:hypothetical protein
MDIAAIDNAANVVGEIAREPDENFQQEQADRYAAIRRFLPRLLKVITFGASSTHGRHVLAALELACDEDRYRILSQSIRSGRRPVAGGRLVVR